MPNIEPTIPIKLRVLILEDSPMDAEIVLRELRRAGYAPEWQRVETESAFLAALETAPELILSDYNLPNFDGLRAVALVRGRGLETPFILISGMEGEDHAVAAIKQGADDYLLKDRLARLGSAVAHALESQRLRTARRQSEAALAGEHELLRTVIDNLPGYIFAQDTAGRYLVSNRAHGQWLCGPDATKLIGKTAFDFFPEETARAFAADDETVMRTGQPVLEREETTEVDGQRHWYQLAKLPLRDQHGQIIGLVGLKIDITARKSLEEQLLRAQRMEAIGALAGGIAHDLNNTLAPILMASEFLKISTKDPETAHIIDTIHDSAQRGAGMVKQILTFACGTAGERGVVQVKHLLRDMIGIARQTFDQAIAIRSDVASDIWPVLGNPTQLHQILLNLCVNARDAMPEGGTLTLTASNVRLDQTATEFSPEAKPGAYVALAVKDTGTGMTPEVQKRIFDPFFTTKPPGKGTGLGLATASGIIKTHGGFLTLESAVGKGTTFKVHLPAQLDAATQAAETERPALPTGHGELILIVDDEVSILGIASQILLAFGYRVLTAGDGVGALASCAENAADLQLMITDMDMPIMDGLATIRVVRKLAPRLKIIVMSGAENEGRVSELASLGASTFRRKPFNAEQLLRTVDEALHAPAKG